VQRAGASKRRKAAAFCSAAHKTSLFSFSFTFVTKWSMSVQHEEVNHSIDEIISQNSVDFCRKTPVSLWLQGNALYVVDVRNRL